MNSLGYRLQDASCIDKIKKIFAPIFLIDFLFFAVICILQPSPCFSADGAMIDFKVKNYHVKSYQSVWDPKTGLVTMDRDVDISLYLSDGTTAHILSDRAEENRVEGTGLAQGHVRALWQDLTITSDEARWDLVAQKARFYSPDVSSETFKRSHLQHLNYMNGQLMMNYDVLENAVDSQNRSLMTATKAKGVWTPYENRTQDADRRVQEEKEDVKP